MSVRNTLAKRTDSVVDSFVRALDALSEDAALDSARVLFGPKDIAPPGP